MYLLFSLVYIIKILEYSRKIFELYKNKFMLNFEIYKKFFKYF
jgi:hypothetical protein